jgi:hypothetical protein
MMNINKYYMFLFLTLEKEDDFLFLAGVGVEA